VRGGCYNIEQSIWDWEKDTRIRRETIEITEAGDYIKSFEVAYNNEGHI
jgi:hypothetical protein